MSLTTGIVVDASGSKTTMFSAADVEAASEDSVVSETSEASPVEFVLAVIAERDVDMASGDVGVETMATLTLEVGSTVVKLASRFMSSSPYPSSSRKTDAEAAPNNKLTPRSTRGMRCTETFPSSAAEPPPTDNVSAVIESVIASSTLVEES